MKSDACGAACGWCQIHVLSRQARLKKKYVDEQISLFLS
jgi:hypothetical protein